MGLTGFTSVLLAGTRGPVANTNFQLRAQGATAQVDFMFKYRQELLRFSFA
jgi:hypothetical protein